LTFARTRHKRPHSLPARFADFRRGLISRKQSPVGGSSLAEPPGLGATGLSGFRKPRHSTDDLDHTMAFSPFKFLQEVRSETAKVTWPSRREVTITTIMVFVMVALASIFFFFADQVIRILITFVLGV